MALCLAPASCTGSHLNVLQLVFQVTPLRLQQISPVEGLLQPLGQTEDVVLLQVHLLLQFGLLVRKDETGAQHHKPPSS